MKASKLIAKILMLCGVSLTCTSCYAPPSATFELKGNVTDELGRPIEGIEVTVRPALRVRDDETEQPGMKGARDTVYTDAKGEFETNKHNRNYLRWALHAEDIDGAESGGEFRSETKEFSVSDRNYDPGEGMYIEEIDFALTETDAADEGE